MSPKLSMLILISAMSFDLVFKGPVVVVPAALRKELMAACHDTHIGVEGCIRRARESMFWPRMTTDLKTYISKCDVCMAHRSAPPKETLQQHYFIPRPWSKVGADLCELNGRTLLVVCDYFSNSLRLKVSEPVRLDLCAKSSWPYLHGMECQTPL